MEQLDATIEDTRMKLYALKVKNKRQYLTDMEARHTLSSHMDTLAARVNKLLREEPQRRLALQPYIFAVRQVMAGHSPQCVQTLQAKLCQSLHFLGISEIQVRKMRSYSKSEAKFGKAQSVSLSDESTFLTMNLVNEISHQDEHNHSLRNTYLEVMKLQNSIIRMLDLQTHPSIGSITGPILSLGCDDNNSNNDYAAALIRMNCSRRSSSKSGRGVFIKSDDLAKHYMEQFEASMEFSTTTTDNNVTNESSSSSNSLYISPVSVIPLKNLDRHQTADMQLLSPSLMSA